MVAIISRLPRWRERLAEATIGAGVVSFMGMPDAWCDDPHWFCINGHVSGRYLKSERYGCSVCLACKEPVVLGPAMGEAAFAPIAAQLRGGEVPA